MTLINSMKRSAQNISVVLRRYRNFFLKRSSQRNKFIAKRQPFQRM